MKDILHRTVRSLEKSLASNPNDIELKVTLAECYVQAGRFDHRTMEFCKAVLTQRPNNLLLQQALSIGMVIKQSHEIENNLRNGVKPAAFNVIGQSIESLDEYLSQSGGCVDAWIALTRLHILAGRLHDAQKGMNRLDELGVNEVGILFDASLKFFVQNTTISEDNASLLSDVFYRLGSGFESV